jgi:hypothetical protein
MRLIRLVGDNEKGFIDNSFETDIEIKKGQQIALQSASFNENIAVLDLDAANNTLVYDLGTATAENELTIELTIGEYDKDNKETLFNEIRDLLCSALNYDVISTSGSKARFGTSFDCSLIGDRVTIRSSQSNFVLNNSRFTSGQAEFVNIVYSSPLLSKSSATNTVNDDAKYASNIPWASQGGVMVHRAQIVNYVDTGTGLEDNGVTLGLSKVAPDTWKNKSQMTADEKTYYIRSNRPADNYKTKIDGGTEQDSGVAPDTIAGNTDDNDYIEWVINEGKLQGYLYRSAQASADLLVEVDYVQGTPLYPFIIFHGGDSNIAVKNGRHTIDPFITSNVPLVEDDEDAVLHANPPPSQSPRIPYTQRLTLSESLANFFGFTNTFNTTDSSITSVSGNRFIQGIFAGNNLFVATLTNTSYMIELRNLKIESYNADTGTRQNIIAVVPKSTGLLNGVVEYEPNNLYFIDIAESGLFRNFKARILRIDGSQILLNGLSILTLLIKD